MPRLSDKMETRRFLRHLAEAKRRYSGSDSLPIGTIDCLPPAPRLPDDPRRRPTETKS